MTQRDHQPDESSALAEPEAESDALDRVSAEGSLVVPEVHEAGPAHLGSTKYVHAAFLAAGVLIAFLAGKLLGTIWNSLAGWPAAVERVPALIYYSEEQRGELMFVVGLVVGAIAVWRVYRNREIQAWAGEVASELSKVYWPDKQVVTKGTVVVLVAGAFATVYVGLLDQLWAFVTALVYGS